MTASAKIQRWTDLLASLLVRKFPATFEQLAENVPGYAIKEGADKTSLMRTFERDKKELREFGIPLETIFNDIGETIGYKLSSRDFYLPYLCLAESGKSPSTPKKVDRYGYQALASLNFAPEELAAISIAAARVRELGDPLLREEAGSAIRKLAFDLPLGSAARADGVERVQSRAHISDAIFEKLNEALLRRKRITFTYSAAYTGASTERHAEPYGLFYVSSQWYLAARDVDRGAMRSFRLSRISIPTLNSSASQKPDYEIPATFKLRHFAASKHAWELGDGDSMEGTVRFVSLTGETQNAYDLGLPAETDCVRKYKIRRPDVFARWLLSFAGNAFPIGPQELVTEFSTQVTATSALYADKTE